MNILRVKLSRWTKKKVKLLQRFLSGLYEKEKFFYKAVEFIGGIEDSYFDRKRDRKDLNIILAYLSSTRFSNEIDVTKSWASDENVPATKVSEKLYNFLLTEKAQKSFNYKVLPSESKKDLGQRARLKRV